MGITTQRMAILHVMVPNNALPGSTGDLFTYLTSVSLAYKLLWGQRLEF